MGKYYNLTAKNNNNFFFIFNTRNPNDPQNPTIQDIEWLPRTKEADHYLNIMGPNAIKMEKNLNKERLALWKQLFLK